MKFFRIFLRSAVYFCLLSFSTTAVSQTQTDSAQLVRVLTYNIKHGATMNEDFDIQRITNVIQSVSPDIVALQEMDFKTNRARKIDLVTELGYLTKLAPLFGRAMPYDDGEYGEGILSRYSFTSTRNNPLPHLPHHEPRAALEVLIELPSGDEFIFIGTHLDHTRDQTDRIAQAKRLNELFKDNTTPTILAGDLNFTPDSDPMKIMSEVWTDACAGNPEMTFPSRNPRRRIDYVLYLPADRWRVVETKVPDERVGSDHLPVFVILELLPEKSD